MTDLTHLWLERPPLQAWRNSKYAKGSSSNQQSAAIFQETLTTNSCAHRTCECDFQIYAFIVLEHHLICFEGERGIKEKRKRAYDISTGSRNLDITRSYKHFVVQRAQVCYRAPLRPYYSRFTRFVFSLYGRRNKCAPNIKQTLNGFNNPSGQAGGTLEILVPSSRSGAYSWMDCR